MVPRSSLRRGSGRKGGKRRSGRLQKKASQQRQQGKKAAGKKSKKQAAKAAKPAPKAKKRLNMEQQSAPVPTSRAESIVSAIIELRCSRGGRGGGGGGREQRGLEMQLCEALWVEVNGHDSSWPFAEPVKKKDVRTTKIHSLEDQLYASCGHYI